MTSVSLVGPRFARQGDVIYVDVYVDAALARLRGYQLHVGVTGGRRGSVDLVDFSTFGLDFGTNTFRSDFSPNGVVDLTDFSKFGQAFGESCL